MTRRNKTPAEAHVDSPSRSELTRTRRTLPAPSDDGGVLLVAGVHDAISARLAERSGFDAVWLSSLGVSTAKRAVPDRNLITLTEMADTVRRISIRIDTPIIADAENGYGDAINAAYAVREFEAAGAAGVCIEDNTFPKQNSFYETRERKLVSVEHMVGKLSACLDARRSSAFLIVARTEALIAGRGIREATRRATAYADAGVDALVVHSADWPTVRTFATGWRATTPLVIIPTAFPEIPLATLASCGFRVVIYANHALRSSIHAMEATLLALRRGDITQALEGCVGLKDIEGLVTLTCRSSGAEPRAKWSQTWRTREP